MTPATVSTTISSISVKPRDLFFMGAHIPPSPALPQTHSDEWAYLTDHRSRTVIHLTLFV
jgi:hypothetical protein